MSEVEPAIAIGGAASGLDSPAIETSSVEGPGAEQSEGAARDGDRDMETAHAIPEPERSGLSQDLAPNGDSGAGGRATDYGVHSETEGGAAISVVPGAGPLELRSENTAASSGAEAIAATEENSSGESEPEPAPLEPTADAMLAAPVPVRSLRS